MKLVFSCLFIGLTALIAIAGGKPEVVLTSGHVDSGFGLQVADPNVEFPMESDSWKNGLFTYTILSALEKLSTDLNGDGLIQVSEIRAYVNKRVEELSFGKQIPSSREENISQDYTIFGH